MPRPKKSRKDKEIDRLVFRLKKALAEANTAWVKHSLLRDRIAVLERQIEDRDRVIGILRETVEEYRQESLADRHLMQLGNACHPL
jgi:hypothetical protein